ncbi:hypothetical protein DRF69_16885 [Chryseobacterium sp. 5_R23647]|nr:hypothetical protein DRF69_16885 [Chryseobacterium sp. 5_R23647]
MKKIIFKIKSFFVITYSRSFKNFEKEYFQKNTELFFSNGERKFSEKEIYYLEIINTCFIPKVLKHY